jgi:hypothetical protein
MRTSPHVMVHVGVLVLVVHGSKANVSSVSETMCLTVLQVKRGQRTLVRRAVR